MLLINGFHAETGQCHECGWTIHNTGVGTRCAKFPMPLGTIHAELAAWKAIAERMRALLGWQCPPGQEDELDAIDADLSRLRALTHHPL